MSPCIRLVGAITTLLYYVKMNSVFEERRSLHEERDRVEMAIVNELLSKKNGHKDKLDGEHRQRALLDRYMKCSKALVKLYEQQDTSRTETSKNSSKAFTSFYLALKNIKELVGGSNEDAPVLEITEPEVQVEFTDEECYGRYLDLTKCHEAFLQVLKREETKPSYLTFLDKFERFSDIHREQKLTSQYKNYVEILLDYFRSYSRRAKPLFDYEKMEATVHEVFLEQWKDRTFPGWFQDSDRANTNRSQMIDLESYKSCGELMDLGLDCLKNELQARGLKCGGTIEERAKRLWAVRGKSTDEIDDSLRSGPMISKKGKKKKTIEPFTIASIEAKLSMYAEYYNDQRQTTIENVQRKQARTAEERNESDEDISDVEDENPDQNEVVYNPKDLPLGWDGKPIPYWLYKLHGLNLTFTCEICGNATYKGPKTFERHFAEWRHAHGMRCLGIPNTAHFANITKIQDAISLWDKLKDLKQKETFQPLNDEEYEDSQGNVVNKKTYEDLKRQGLL